MCIKIEINIKSIKEIVFTVKYLLISYETYILRNLLFILI